MAEVKRVNIDDKIKVSYCIPDWMRDEQIKQSCVRFKDRIQPVKELRTEPIAVVCFGPSLQKTWIDVTRFKYKMTCSGSHKFLKERGITPDWHVDVDPRPHKLKLIGNNISPDTEFLMASCCHPEVFDHLMKFNAKITLWHTYAGENKDSLPIVYPRGEWVVCGGANVGLRAITIARVLGFTDIHVFGMDGCFEPNGYRHAATHPNAPKDYIVTEFDGKDYATTSAYLECAKMTLHEVEMLPDVKFTFYGEGLVQTMLKKKEIHRKHKSGIAFFSQPIISTEYMEMNRKLHEVNAAYGISVLKYLDTIKTMYEKTESKSLLDYGCGKGLLARSLDFPIWEYDPAIPGKDKAPRPADLVVCIDVLEHIEPDYLNSVLEDIARCIKKVGFFTISTKPAVKYFPDGRNTHLIQEGKEWWVERLSKYFMVPEKGAIQRNNGELYVVVSPKVRVQTKNTLEVCEKEAVLVNN
jgi:hypothetical protein